jgi:hypothetical protein
VTGRAAQGGRASSPTASAFLAHGRLESHDGQTPWTSEMNGWRGCDPSTDGLDDNAFASES